ncbi:MAG: 16S rRNA (adenine(1518)-N(6)/adenine(1519)-N(6))-dimethyltransferase RsmA [Candidatus Moranbacteria bacterium]|nr:16S rRNA (adenine(1518)-N(6)/adenine(1519)-N(6))-dimethyltransferase RsmA [Candidatus Moranbacteria bacterium]
MPTKLGQNFLRDKTVLDKIIQAANLSADDLVIEVGPGEGVLTKELARLAGKVIAIETDEELAKKTARNLKFEILNLKSNPNDKILNSKSNTTIVLGDILEINLPELILQNTKYQIPDTKYKVVANIPYYITSPIIRLFLETKYPPTEMILMVQKEVAERICAKAGKMSILALSVQYYATPELLFTVPAKAFFPVPEVDSAVIRIARNKKQETRNKEGMKKFFRIVKAGFSAKRKTLVNNLSSSLKLEKAVVEEKLKQIEISQNQRAQELSLEDWKKLVELI